MGSLHLVSILGGIESCFQSSRLLLGGFGVILGSVKMK